MKILVCAHKDDYVRNDDLYIPIQVGCDLTDKNLGFIKDNTGDNISAKNVAFCELTALYWAWKNLPNEDIIGLAHYRRYLDLSKGMFHPQMSFKFTQDDSINKSGKKKIEKILSKHDIIVATKHVLEDETIASHYEKSHVGNDLKTLRDVIIEVYPEYKDSFDAVMQSNECSFLNMFIAKSDFVNNYCKWLFDVLFELEKRIDTSEYDSYQKRIYGFMAERLLNVYIHKNRLNVKYCSVTMIDSREKSYLSRKWRNIKTTMEQKKHVIVSAIKCYYTRFFTENQK